MFSAFSPHACCYRANLSGTSIPLNYGRFPDTVTIALLPRVVLYVFVDDQNKPMFPDRDIVSQGDGCGAPIYLFG